ncbi:MAG: TauD/TfdA family dioxygenase [Pseudomonadota bacterium]|nr:TauD/TfdA family dioxygenase [Pseudomonadota bacterium]
MSLKITPVTDDFVAEASGLDLRETIDVGIVREIEAAMDTYAVLVWRDQPLDDDQHMTFTNWFGPLDMGLLNVTKKQNRFKHAGFVDIANVDVNDRVMARDHTAVTSSMANQFWHTDSSFMKSVAKYSLLSARLVPKKGGDTEFADMRAAYDRLPHDLRDIVTGLIGEHHPLYSRILLGNTYSDEQMASIPPAHWPLVRTHPGSRRVYLFTPIHIHKIKGMSVPEARILVNELIDHATQPHFVYRHRWKPDDLVMWDNRCTLHRGRRFDYAERRELRRTTTMEHPVQK